MPGELPRRAVLSAAALPLPALILPADPDAALKATWAAWCHALRALDAMPPDASDAVCQPLNDRIDAAAERLSELPARTPAGLALKLRVLLIAHTRSAASVQAALSGLTPAPDSLDDFPCALFWSLIADAERMAGAG